MFPALRRTALADFIRALVATGGVALVLGLTMIGASRELHDQLHQGTPTSEESCPVTLFANGIPLSLDPVKAVAPDRVDYVYDAAQAGEIFLAAARYLLRPERGPPAQV